MSYPYLLTTLPPLIFQKEVPLSQDEFLELCHNLVPPKAYADLLQLFSQKANGNQMVEDYFLYEHSLDNEVTQIRARHLGRTVPVALTPLPYAPVGEAQEVMNAHNPRESEQARLYSLWAKLDSLKTTEFLNYEALAIYALQLRLLHRKDLFQRQKGEMALQMLAKNLLPERYLHRKSMSQP